MRAACPPLGDPLRDLQGRVQGGVQGGLKLPAPRRRRSCSDRAIRRAPRHPVRADVRGRSRAGVADTRVCVEASRAGSGSASERAAPVRTGAWSSACSRGIAAASAPQGSPSASSTSRRRWPPGVPIAADRSPPSGDWSRRRPLPLAPTPTTRSSCTPMNRSRAPAVALRSRWPRRRLRVPAGVASGSASAADADE
jgi:hypothetical protein